MSSKETFHISGNIFDVLNRRSYPGELVIRNGFIIDIHETKDCPPEIILPGFIDAHVHIESSMLPPSEFARLAVRHGTVATVSDPHEIANVLGMEGVHWMIENARRAALKIFFGAPSCVPATTFETAGATLSSAQVGELLRLPEIFYLSEMMNFPGVLQSDSEVMAKLDSAKKEGKVIDGHAPGLRGTEARLYASHGISTDHECFTEAEARDKIAAGMKIIIREGSAAKNFDALIDLLDEFPDSIMFCSDDKHPNDLVVGHIDELVKRAIRRGKNYWDVLSAASVNPIRHYRLPVGLLQKGDPADFIVVDSLEQLNIRSTYINGSEVASRGTSLLPRIETKPINNFSCGKLEPEMLRMPALSDRIRAIEVLPGQLISKELQVSATISDGCYQADSRKDLLKLLVLNRYRSAPPALAFVSGFGLHDAAIASTVAHDSHNIVAAGTSDELLTAAVNLLVASRGGISLASQDYSAVLELPIAGLMSDLDGGQVAERYEALDKKAKELGSPLPAPFMTLAFLALLVIPELKLSDRGLFDGRSFRFTSLEL